MIHQYQLVEDVLDSDACKLITESSIYVPLQNSYTNGRRNNYAILHILREENAEAVSPLIQLIKDEYPNLTVEKNHNNNPHFMIFQYGVDDHFDLFHIDINYDAPAPNNSLLRKKTVVVLLSDSYTGGKFELKDEDVNFHKPGSVLIFDADHLHKVNPVTEGYRYSMIAWLVEK